MKRPALLTTLCLCGIMLAACKPRTTQEMLDPVNALGSVLAEKTAQLAGTKKQIVIIAADSSWGPMSTAENAFRAALKKQGLTVMDTRNINPGDPMKSGTIGLQSAEFFGVLAKNPSAGAIVSFLGAPLFESSDSAKMSAAHPPILVVATARLGATPGVPGDRQVLTNLVEANWIQLAVIDGSGNAAASDGKSNPTHQSFDEHFAVLTSGK